VDIDYHWIVHTLNLCCLYFQYPAFYQTTNFSSNVDRSNLNFITTVANNILSIYLVAILSLALVNCTVFIMAATQSCALVTTLATPLVNSSTFNMAATQSCTMVTILPTILANTSVCSMATTHSCTMVATYSTILANSSLCNMSTTQYCPMVATLSTNLASRSMCSMSIILVTNFSCILATTQDSVFYTIHI
jgi:hypothetical protein